MISENDTVENITMGVRGTTLNQRYIEKYNFNITWNYLKLKRIDEIKHQQLYLIQSMIQQDYLSSLISFVDQDVAGMGVTMNIALDKYHLAVKLPQVLCDLDNHRKSELHIV